MTFLKIILPLGWLVGAWCCRELCHCDRAYREDIWYDWFHWLLARRWITRMVLPTYSISTTLTSRVPTSYSSTVPAAHEPGTCSISSTTSTVAAALESWPRRSTYRHGAPSPSFVLRYRELTATSSFVLPPSRWPTPAGRRGHVRTPVLFPRLATAC